MLVCALGRHCDQSFGHHARRPRFVLITALATSLAKHQPSIKTLLFLQVPLGVFCQLFGKGAQCLKRRSKSTILDCHRNPHMA